MHIIKKGLLAFALLVISGLSYGQVMPGSPAPDFSLPDARDSVISLSSFKGNVVLVDFWASWCGPCRASNPSVERLYKKYRSRGLVVLGVSIDDRKRNWLKAVSHDGLTYAQVNDRDGWNSAVAALYGVNAIPATFLIGRDGRVVAIDAEGKDLEKMVRQLLK